MAAPAKQDSPPAEPKPAAAPHVVRARAERIAADPALMQRLGLPAPPLAKARIEVELEGVPTEVASALRRVMLDELRGHCLWFDLANFRREAATDLHMLPDFVRDRLRLVPLRPQLPPEAAELRYELRADNPTPSARTVFSGDLRVVRGAPPADPLFNPLFELAVLQPGRSLHITDIHIAEGYGRDHASFQLACRAASRPLDMAEAPRAETHAADGPRRYLSGFLVPPGLADPRRHLVTAVIPATLAPPEALAVAAEACANVRDRLRAVAEAVEPGARGQYSVIDLRKERGLYEATLRLKGETHTVGALLRRALHDLEPGLAYVGYVCFPHEGEMRLTLRHAAEPTPLLLRALQQLRETFEALRRELA